VDPFREPAPLLGEVEGMFGDADVRGVHGEV
jgi:hypothetical protein